MSNDRIFRALSSPTRLNILKTLAVKEMHLTGLAKEIGISVPVTSRHIKILENVGLIKRRVFGNVHLLSTKTSSLEKAIEPFIVESTIKISKDKNLFDALKQVPGVEVSKVGNHRYIKSIDGEEGYYIYEVDGKLPDKPIDEYIINEDLTLDLNKLVSVKKKKIRIDVKSKQ